MLTAFLKYVDMVHAQKLGFASHNAARDTFYMRAKLLYDLDCEEDPFSVQQALVLMTYWVGIPAVQKDTWYWHGLAVNSLQSISLPEPTFPDASTLPQSLKFQKRLWWGCFIRDACLALGLRCAPRMKFDECTMAMPSLEDFEETPGGVHPGESTSTSHQCSYDPERTLAVIFVQMAKLCLIINGTQAFFFGSSRASSTDTSALPCCDIERDTRTSLATTLLAQRLQSWLAGLPAECCYTLIGQEDQTDSRFDRLEARVKVHVVLVNMFYYSVVCHLHFPQLLLETGNDLGQLFCETTAPSIAVDMVRAAIHELTTLSMIVIRDNLIDHLPAAS